MPTRTAFIITVRDFFVLKFSQNSLEILSKFSQNSVRGQSNFSQNPVKMQSKCSLNSVKMQFKFSQKSVTSWTESFQFHINSKIFRT